MNEKEYSEMGIPHLMEVQQALELELELIKDALEAKRHEISKSMR
jgi:hypothetical protein